MPQRRQPSPALRLLFSLLLANAFLACGYEEGGEKDGAEEADLRRAIGQMLVVGFRGMELDESMPIVGQIRRGEVGGVVLFDRDVQHGENIRNIESPQQLQALIASIVALRPDDPPLVMVDQEGGRVARLKEAYGFPASRSAQSLGEQNDPALSRSAAEATGALLAEMGFHLNLAPVVDVNTNAESPAIGKIERSFSSDPDQVAIHAEATIDGLNAHGLLSALKHFPGHGSASDDSHLGFVDVTSSWDELELEPYRALIAKGKVDLVMSAHVFHAELDPDWPSTLSEKIIQDLLRDELGFQGPVISDDMQMGAILEHYDRRSALHRAILAGHDLLIYANNNPVEHEEEIAPQLIEMVLELIAAGELDEARIYESQARIRNIKERIPPWRK